MRTEYDAALCGRRAGECARETVAATGRLSVDEFWPRASLRVALKDLVASSDIKQQELGRWWTSYLDAFEAAFPEHENHLQ
ncbi:hypothetical protein A1D31_31390 [Bradyrhizobium liaoningense]|nr:hypothetical protein A1D31_31390 [Bradyrhizobium liaoningense]